MEPWLWALVLKVPAAMLVAGLYYVFVIKGLRWLYAKLPRSRIIDFLFKERANKRPDYGPGFGATDTDLGRIRPTEPASLQPPQSPDHRLPRR